MARTFQASGKTYIISNHAWRKIRKIDIPIADIVRIIENDENRVKLRHKTEYTGNYTPRWAASSDRSAKYEVRIVIDTRSTLKLKTVYILGKLLEDET
jgi:hypothetical protein